MSDRPILFSAPMIRALLAGTKTQTRLAWRVQPPPGVRIGWTPDSKTPYGQVGDRLWVRETWAVSHALDHLKPREVPQGAGLVYYAATENLGGLLKRPSIFMPRWASRITLEITGVRVERLQAISEADARAEGVEPAATHNRPGAIATCFGAYSVLWESINGPGSWDANPWVWCVSFKRDGAA